MSTRYITKELKAKLRSKSGNLFSKPSGKIERKTYKDGAERLKVTVRNLRAPDHSVALVKSNNEVIAKIILTRGSGVVDEEIDTLPSLSPGQLIEVEVQGKTLLSGRLYED